MFDVKSKCSDAEWLYLLSLASAQIPRCVYKKIEKSTLQEQLEKCQLIGEETLIALAFVPHRV